MKFWFVDGALILLLLFSTVSCDQDLPAEMNATAGNQTMEVPCSLDDNGENRTECNNSSQVSLSSSPTSLGTFNPNSTEHLISTACPPEGCPTSYEPEESTSIESSSGSTMLNLSKTSDLTEHPATTEYSTITPIVLLNQTSIFETASTSESILPTEGASEMVSNNTSDTDEMTSLKTSHDNSTASYSGNDSVTSQTVSASVVSTDLQNISSNSSEGNFSESLYTDNSPVNTTLSSITSHFVELNDTTTDNLSSTQFSVFSTSYQFSNVSEVSNSTEMVTLTETSETLVTVDNITDQDSNASTLITKPINESFSSSTEFTTENITFETFFGKSTPSIEDTTSDNSTSPFYTILFSSNTSDDSTSPFYTFSSNTSDTTMSSTISSTITEENTSPSTDVSVSLTDTSTVVNTELPLIPSDRKYVIIVELRINCSGNVQEREISMSVAQLFNATLKDDYDKDCSNLHNITLSIFQDSVDFATVYKLISKNIKNAELIRIVYGNGVNTTKNVTISDSDVTESEMILYITLGVCLGAIFLIALAIICFKCCRRRPSKPIDLDVPHLNLRLEDYTLTRIPRPNTVYLDYFRGPIVSDRYSTAPLRNSMNASAETERGLVQPFDTSVVPLEDAKKLDELATSPGRTSSTCPSTPLRTFGRKDWKRGDNLIYENVISSSTEKLHPDFYKYGYPGMENPTFAA